jgi:hypothetical protein
MIRRPAIIGAAGFDFGTKPAISIATRRKPIKKQILCPIATLVCDSTAYGLIKCGYYFRKYDYAGAGGHNEYIRVNNVHRACPGTGSSTYDEIEDWVTPVYQTLFLKRTTTYTACTYGGGTTGVSGLRVAVLDPDNRDEDGNCTETIDDTGAEEIPYIFDDVLSDEYLTSDLIADVEAALPAYPGTFDGDCVASRFLVTPEETEYAIERFKYKFTFSSPACAGMVVTWVVRTILDLTEDVTFEGTLYQKGRPDPDPSHWTNAVMSWTAVGAETETLVYGPILEPSENGETTVEEIAVDCTACF